MKILVVEDEPLIAMMLEDFLDILGHKIVATCDTVQSALAVVAEGDLEAAILDVNLSGGEKSWAVADALAAASVPFVFASGGTSETIEERFRDRPTLAKPYSMDGLEAALDGLG